MILDNGIILLKSGPLARNCRRTLLTINEFWKLIFILLRDSFQFFTDFQNAFPDTFISLKDYPNLVKDYDFLNLIKNNIPVRIKRKKTPGCRE